MRVLISIEENNQQIMEQHKKQEKYGMPTGVACPKCGGELHQKGLNIKMSYPPQATVICPDCEHLDSIYI